MRDTDIIRLAQQTFLAMKNPWNSVEKVYPQAICAARRREKIHYVGVKNTAAIPVKLLGTLREEGYELHTLDRCSVNGRAVDMALQNPLTGRPMTGSSSGTAINVFLGINDLGIGTDGGGSVLAPAMSLQCCGFISPLLEAEHMKKYEKKSTDGLCFTPSLGFIARDLEVLGEAVKLGLGIGLCEEEALEEKGDIVVICSDSLSKKVQDCLGGPERSGIWPAKGGPKQAGVWPEEGGSKQAGIRPGTGIRLETRKFPPLDSEREPLITFLREHLPMCDVVISHEKRIDVDGLGDSILGHFDRETRASQAKSGKQFIRVANMAGATALCIPDGSLAGGFVLMCQSEPGKIRKLFETARRFPVIKDELLERYFRNMDAYFPCGVLEAELYGG